VSKYANCQAAGREQCQNTQSVAALLSHHMTRPSRRIRSAVNHEGTRMHSAMVAAAVAAASAQARVHSGGENSAKTLELPGGGARIVPKHAEH
jgi:hypothetical protein